MRVGVAIQATRGTSQQHSDLDLHKIEKKKKTIMKNNILLTNIQDVLNNFQLLAFLKSRVDDCYGTLPIDYGIIEKFDIHIKK